MVGQPEESREASYTNPNSFLDDDTIARKILCEVAETKLKETPSGNMALPDLSCSSKHEHSYNDSSLKKLHSPVQQKSLLASSSSSKALNYDQSCLKSPKENHDLTMFPNSPRTQTTRPQNLNDLVYCEDLVVATAVYEHAKDESDDGGYLPTCVEFDPDSKPALYKSIYYRRIAYAVCVMLFVIVVATTVAVKRFKSESINEMEWMREEVETIVGTQVELQDEPYRKALNWMMYNDPLRQSLFQGDSTFVQRYILTYFYFATSVDAEWAYCAPPQEGDESTCSYLLDVSWKDITHSKGQFDGHRWLSDTHTCEWAGIECNEDNQITALLFGTLLQNYIYIYFAGIEVQYILTIVVCFVLYNFFLLKCRIDAFKISGVFPKGLYFLSTLTSLTLADGTLHGPLPADIISRMPQLKELRLTLNQFTGPIPQQWFDDAMLLPTPSQLFDLHLGYNMLSGVIPSDITAFDNLQLLTLKDNQLNGTIPEQIFATMTNLTVVDVSVNHLTGTIPNNVGQLVNLVQLNLNGNKLRGTIPSSINSSYESLNELNVGSNDLTGELPREVYDLNHLIRLDISNNRINGTIKSIIGRSFPKLKYLLINSNYMGGSLPIQIGYMKKLEEFVFIDNAFTGLLPDGLCKFVSEKCCRICCTVDGAECPMNSTKV
jgi:hypothetical protein